MSARSAASHHWRPCFALKAFTLSASRVSLWVDACGHLSPRLQPRGLQWAKRQTLGNSACQDDRARLREPSASDEDDAPPPFPPPALLLLSLLAVSAAKRERFLLNSLCSLRTQDSKSLPQTGREVRSSGSSSARRIASKPDCSFLKPSAHMEAESLRAASRIDWL